MKIYSTLKFLIFATFWIVQDIIITYFRYNSTMLILSNGGFMELRWYNIRCDQADQIKRN